MEWIPVVIMGAFVVWRLVLLSEWFSGDDKKDEDHPNDLGL